MKTDTPETDAAWGAWPYAGSGVSVHFARKLERERDRWKRQHETVVDERAKSFAMLDKAVGGTGLTEYQPEIDICIEAAIVAWRGLLADAREYIAEVNVDCAADEERDQMLSRLDAILKQND